MWMLLNVSFKGDVFISIEDPGFDGLFIMKEDSFE